MSQNLDYNHFGHRHTLVPLELDDGERLSCKACEHLISPPFHGCVSCAYYLHDRCLRLPRSLDHRSHPSHPLTLLPLPTYSTKEFVCDACRSTGTAFSYGCCRCGFDVHVHCAFLPETATLAPEKHPHGLKLEFGFRNEENSVYMCDVCGKEVDEQGWRYACSAGCDFGTHLQCAGAGYADIVDKEEAAAATVEKNDPVAAMRQANKEMMEFQLATAKMQQSLNLSAAYANIMSGRFG